MTNQLHGLQVAQHKLRPHPQARIMDKSMVHPILEIMDTDLLEATSLLPMTLKVTFVLETRTPQQAKILA
jgi:hypothetical protein